MLVVKLILGLTVGYLIVALFVSWIKPEIKEARIITFFGKIFAIISNIDGKKIYTGENDHVNNLTKWDLIDGESRSNIFGLPINLYFYFWPFFKMLWYDLTYVKAKRKGEEVEGDTIVWTSEDGRDILISRTSKSNHFLYRATYPMISAEFETKDFGRVRIFTDNVLELQNPGLASTGIDNWMQFSANVLDGAFRGIVSTLTLEELNQISTGTGSFSFNGAITGLVNGKTPIGVGQKLKLGDVGFKLARTVFKDFEPVGEKTKKMMEAISEKMIVERLGDAEIAGAERKAKVLLINADAKAEAYAKEQKAIVEWKKKFLVDTGLGEIDNSGRITKLLPDANTKAWTDAMAELSKLTGTLVMDPSSVMKMLNINPTKND